MNRDAFAVFEWPAWAQMWAVAFTIYIGCKWLTWHTATVRAPLWKHAAYLLAWPGMDATTFLGAPPSAGCAACRPVEWIAASGKFILGLALLFGATRMLPFRNCLLYTSDAADE